VAPFGRTKSLDQRRDRVDGDLSARTDVDGLEVSVLQEQ
jgi:hypothetical protein